MVIPLCAWGPNRKKKKDPSILFVFFFFFFPAIIIYPSTFTPAINRKEGDGVVARCDIQQ